MLKAVVRFQNQGKSNKDQKKKKKKKKMPKIIKTKVKTLGSDGDSNEFSTK